MALPEDADRLYITLANNLSHEQLPFVIKNRSEYVSCQLVLYDEQVTVLKLSVPTLSVVRLHLNDEDNIPPDNTERG